MFYPSQQNYIEQVSIDCVIFGYQQGKLKVLVPKLKFRGDFYALPSGFVYQDEDIDQAAKRILSNRTGIDNIYLEQFYVFGNANRDTASFLNKMISLNPDLIARHADHHQREYDWHTKRFISIGYYALVDINQVVPKKNELDASIDWYTHNDLPNMILDHTNIVEKALSTLRSHLDQRLTAFKLLPETFIMKDVQGVYEAVYGRQFVRTNFQKKILDLNVLDRLEKKFTGAANKAPYLYRFKS